MDKIDKTNKNTAIVAAIDIGTNSIRLAVVRIEDGQQLTTLALHREVVRLGEGEFETNQMTPEAIERGAFVCAKFADVARGFGAQEIVVFATSAVREAENREDFIQRVQETANIEVRVISGVEEARLIWLGVSSGIELGERRAVLIDIGGGSTETIVGRAGGYEASNYDVLESQKLGAIRLSNKFVTGDGPVSPETYAQMQGYVLGVCAQIARKVRMASFDVALGSAGTIGALADVVARHSPESTVVSGRSITFGLSELREAVRMLCRLPLEARRNVPGMDIARADIVIGGAAVLQTLMEAYGIDRMTTSERGLRDGILLDYLLREDEARQRFQAQSVRRRSILQLARACNYDAEHAEHTAYLCLRLYDELAALGAHSYGERERELLNYAAIVHDIGTFLSHSNHQKHAYYLVRNSDLLGFDDTEINIIANVALYHRKSLPKKKHPNFAELNRDERHVVGALAAILRIAEGMDRSHLSLVQDIAIVRESDPARFVLNMQCASDCQLEVWGVQNSRDLFELVFAAPLVVHSQERPSPVSAPAPV